jgi:beta-glucosidase-like glycosyl hydrolase
MPSSSVRLSVSAVQFSHDVYQNAIIDGVADGSLPLAVVNSRVADVLRVRELLMLNEQPYTDTSLIDTDLNTEAARALARLIATQSIVLLKNSAVNSEPLLPLAPRVNSGAVKRIAVVGILSDLLNVADYAGRRQHKCHTAMTATHHHSSAVASQTDRGLLSLYDFPLCFVSVSASVLLCHFALRSVQSGECRTV